jgi:hypothetical protein
MRPLHAEEIEENRARFDFHWRRRWLGEVCLLPTHHHDRVHFLLKQAYRLGLNDERRKHEPEQMGGMD